MLEIPTAKVIRHGSAEAATITDFVIIYDDLSYSSLSHRRSPNEFHLFRLSKGLAAFTELTIAALTLNSLTIARQGGPYSAMLMLVPLDEMVTLTITYEVLTLEFETTFVRPPFSRTMTLRAAVAAALNCRTAKASITARGITYGDPETFRRIWARREFHQGWQ